MSTEPEPISPDARRALEQELAGLRADRAKIAATLQDTDSAGDRADQADELQRATDVARLDDRISAIDLRLRQASIAGPPPTDAVGVGSTVTVRFDDDTTETVQIGIVAEAPDLTLVTADSPLGHALLGHHTGDVVGYDTPEGHATATVVAIAAR